MFDAGGRLFEGSFRQALPAGHQAPDVLAFFRGMQAEGRLETRDRVHGIGEQVCDYADLEGDGCNPFRVCKKQLSVNVVERKIRALCHADQRRYSSFNT